MCHKLSHNFSVTLQVVNSMNVRMRYVWPLVEGRGHLNSATIKNTLKHSAFSIDKTIGSHLQWMDCGMKIPFRKQTPIVVYEMPNRNAGKTLSKNSFSSECHLGLHFFLSSEIYLIL